MGHIAIGPRVIWCLLWVAALSACQRNNQIGDDCDSELGSCDPTSSENRIDKVDILFVIDKSPSMLEAQTKLAGQMTDFVKILVTGQLPGGTKSDSARAKSINFGVITSDLGHPGVNQEDSLDPDHCDDKGDDGVLKKAGDPTIDPSCPQTSADLYIAHDVKKSLIEKSGAELACRLKVGTSGCQFKQPLEAALKALWPSTNQTLKFLGTQGHGDKENLRFLRLDSLLVIIAVTDEDDCSVGAQGSANLFLRASAPDLPDFLKADPLKATKDHMRCFYDYELRWSEQYRYAIERYIDGFKALRPEMKDRVIFAVIGGVPIDLVGAGSSLPQDILGDVSADQSERMIAYYGNVLDDADMIEQEDKIENTDIGKGYLKDACSESAAIDPTGAKPARRLVKLAQSFGVNGVVQSICEDTFVNPMAKIALAITNRIESSAANAK
jgi:hypothetical protein